MTQQEEDREALDKIEQEILTWCSEKKVESTPVNVIQAMFDLYYADWLGGPTLNPTCNPSQGDTMSKLIWRVKQLLPLAYWTKYRTESGQPRFAIWRMWMGRCFNVVDVPVAI